MKSEQAATTAASRTSVEAAKLEKRLYRLVGLAIGNFNMMVPGDKVML